jgi:NDP-sugar pyrophosphorylase family protein
MLSGYWQDAGTYDNLLKANVYWANKNKPII